MHGSSNDCQDALCTGWNHRQKKLRRSMLGIVKAALSHMIGLPGFLGNKIQPSTREAFP